MSPVRLYLFLSILFFFIASINTRRGAVTSENVNFTLTGDSIGQVSFSDSLFQEIMDKETGSAAVIQNGEISDTSGISVPGKNLKTDTHNSTPENKIKEVLSSDLTASDAENTEGTGGIAATNDSMAMDTTLSDQAMDDAKEAIIENSPTSMPQEEETRKSKIENKLEESTLEMANNPKVFLDNLLKNTSYALFILMPVFALLLQVFFLRQKRYYVEHLIFSINMHSFALLILTVRSTIYYFFPASSNYLEFIVLIIPVYFVIGMKRFYIQGFWRILLKSIGLGILYGALIFLTLAILALLTLLWL